MSQVAIIGVGQTTYRRAHADKSSRELIWQAAREALDDAGLGIDAIDVVMAGVAPDALAGEASVERSGMIGIGKPFARINTGGVTGSSTVFAGASYIKAGRARAVLVVALERMGQATTSQQVFNTIFDPVYEKDFPLTTITMAALRASMLMRLYGYTHRHWAEIAARNYQHARRNPLAHLHLDITPGGCPQHRRCWPGRSIATRRARCRRAPAPWCSSTRAWSETARRPGSRARRRPRTATRWAIASVARKRRWSTSCRFASRRSAPMPRPGSPTRAGRSAWPSLLGVLERRGDGLPGAGLLRVRRRPPLRRGAGDRPVVAGLQPVGRSARREPSQRDRDGQDRRMRAAGAADGRRAPSRRRQACGRHRPGRRHAVLDGLRARRDAGSRARIP